MNVFVSQQFSVDQSRYLYLVCRNHTQSVSQFLDIVQKGEENPCVIKREFVKVCGNNNGKYFQSNVLKEGGIGV